MDVDTSSEDALDDEPSLMDQKLDELQRLSADYITGKPSFTSSQERECLWQIMDALNLLKSDQLFIFSFRNNQVVNCFILKTLELLITSDTKLRVRNEGLTLLVYLIESTSDLSKKAWIWELYHKYFRKILILVHNIMEEDDVTLTPTTFNLVSFEVVWVPFHVLVSHGVLSEFLEYLKKYADRFPLKFILKVTDSVLKSYADDPDNYIRISVPRTLQYVKVFNVLVSSVVKLYDIHKNYVVNKTKLNFTVLAIEFVLKLSYSCNEHNGLFRKEITKLCCKIYEYSFELCLEELRSKNENLEYVDSILKNVYRMLDYDIDLKTKQHVNHDFLDVLIKLLKIICSRNYAVPIAAEKSCLRLMSVLVHRTDINPDYLWTHFWEHLEPYFTHLFKYNQEKVEIDHTDVNILTGKLADIYLDFLMAGKWKTNGNYHDISFTTTNFCNKFIEAFKGLFELKLARKETVLTTQTFIMWGAIFATCYCHDIAIEEARSTYRHEARIVLKLQMRVVEDYNFIDFMQIPLISYIVFNKLMCFLHEEELWNIFSEHFLRIVHKLIGWFNSGLSKTEKAIEKANREDFNSIITQIAGFASSMSETTDMSELINELSKLEEIVQAHRDTHCD